MMIIRRALTVAVLLSGIMAAHAASTIQRKQLLNDGWWFVENDSNFTKSKAVTLPHDWSILHDFDAKAPSGNDGGYLPTGKGWYRRVLTLGKEYAGKKVRLYFEGVYMNSHVYVNGHASEEGNKRANQILSNRRAETIAELLMKLGVPAEQLVVHGFNADVQYQSTGNSTRSQRELNRRVEIIPINE